MADVGSVEQLEALGVKLTDPVEKFWTVFANGLDDEPERAAVIAAGKDIKKTFNTFTVGLLRNPAITRKDMEDPIAARGGKRGWVKSIQFLLGHTYEGPNIPESAALLVAPSTKVVCAREPQNYSAKGEKIGSLLKRQKQMHLLRFPAHLATDCIEDTPEPWSVNYLHYHDRRRLMTFLFLWVVTNFKSSRKDMIMFRYLAVYLHSIFSAVPEAKFVKMMWERWKNGNSTKAKVSTRAALPPAKLSSAATRSHWHAAVRAPQLMYKSMGLSPDDENEGVLALKKAGLFVPIATNDSEDLKPKLTLEYDAKAAVASALQPGDENAAPQASLATPLVLPPSSSEARGTAAEPEGAADVGDDTGTSTAVVAAVDPEKTAPANPRKRSQAAKAEEIATLGARITASQPASAAPPAPGGTRLPPCAGKKDAPEVVEPAGVPKAKGRGAKRANAPAPAAAAKAARGKQAVAPGAAAKKAPVAKAVAAAGNAPAPKPKAGIATCVIAPKAGKAHDVVGLRKTATDNDDTSDFYKSNVKRDEYVTILEEASSESGTEYVHVSIGNRHGWLKKAYVTRIAPIKKAAAGRKVARDEDEGKRPLPVRSRPASPASLGRTSPAHRVSNSLCK